MTQIYSDFLGRLSLDSLPITALIKNPGTNEIVANVAALIMLLGVVVVVFVLTKFHLWKPLWADWLTSTDHKRIGIMYIVFAIVMLARGVIEGVVMRAQQAIGDGAGFLEPDHFAQLFSTHGTIMTLWLCLLCLVLSTTSCRFRSEHAMLRFR